MNEPQYRVGNILTYFKVEQEGNVRILDYQVKSKIIDVRAFAPTSAGIEIHITTERGDLIIIKPSSV